MFALIASAALLLPVEDPPTTPTPDVRRAYDRAQAAAGRTPDDQVRLAYWCEAHGLAAERLRHLAQAVLADPDHAAARGLLGLVARRDQWLKPEAVATQVNADPTLLATLAEYDARRSATPYTADGQLALATWAEERGLADQAKAHYTAVVRLDPRRDAAWKKLGYKKHDGNWATDAEVAAAKADAEAQRAADHRWKSLLEKWKAQLARPSQRAEAEANLAAVVDPRAVPMIGKVFGAHEADLPVAVQLLGQVDAPGASKALAYLAAFAPPADARRRAAETLRGRDPREYANLLIGLIGKPIRYEVQRVNGPNAPGVLFVEGEKANVKRLYTPKSLIQPTDRISVDRFGQPTIERVTESWWYSRAGRPFNPRTLLGFGSSYSDNYGTDKSLYGDLYAASLGQSYAQYLQAARWQAATQPSPVGIHSMADLTAKIKAGQHAPANNARQVVAAPWAVASSPLFNPRDVASETAVAVPLAQAVAESNRSAAVSQQQLDRDVAQLDRQNLATNAMNDRVVAILNDATNQSLPAERTPWERWYVNLLGYAFITDQTQQNPTFTEVIPSGYQPEVPTNVVQRQFYVSGVSCFGAGTPVQTLTGPRPIEQLRVGDMVLTQSVTTGALGYHPVTVTHHNPPAATFRIQLDDDTVVASAFHRFWVARRGWIMARDLKAGDAVRTLGGVRPVAAVAAGQVELVYNLDVAGDADFFAGTSAALVHDNTLPDPRLVPFDLPKVEDKAIAAR